MSDKAGVEDGEGQPTYATREERDAALVEMYTTGGKTIREIVDIHGLSIDTVRKVLKRAGVFEPTPAGGFRGGAAMQRRIDARGSLEARRALLVGKTPDVTQIAVGKRIAEVRKRENLTQRDLGDLVGRTWGAVWGWESGRDAISYAQLVQVAAVTRTPVEYLATGKGPSTMVELQPGVEAGEG